ncbi:ANTAR domain-containing protein [Streptomyces sp. NPDC051322]|uniref:ANTAR domain-containing protein n=1 Tax=Streptomyces sp. NPDC051322 TaxID=3154645 RepID=UPI00344ED064
MSTAFDHARDPHDAAPAQQPHGTPGEAAWCAELDQLRAEVGQLRQAMKTRPVIDQARGMVMVLGPCSSQTAWEVLVEVSQHSNTKLRDVAEALVATATGESMPCPVGDALTGALRRLRTGGRQ